MGRTANWTEMILEDIAGKLNIVLAGQARLGRIINAHRFETRRNKRELVEAIKPSRAKLGAKLGRITTEKVK